MSHVMGGFGLYQALKEQGITMPDECVYAELEFPADGAMRLIYHCNVSDDQLVRIGRAISRMGEESIDEHARQRIREIGIDNGTTP